MIAVELEFCFPYYWCLEQKRAGTPENGDIVLRPFIGGPRGEEVGFYKSVISTWNIFIAAVRTPRNFRVVLYNFSVIRFAVNSIAQQKRALLVSIFCFLKLSLPSTLLLPPGPTAVPTPLEKRVKLFVVVRYFVRDVGVKVKLL